MIKLAERVTEVITNDQLINISYNIVEKMMKGYLLFRTESFLMSQDEIQNIGARLLNQIKKGKNPFDEGVSEIEIGEDIMKHPIARYVVGSVRNECRSRIKNRSDRIVKTKINFVENGKKIEKTISLKKHGARSRVVADENFDVFLDSKISITDSSPELERVNITKYLTEKGLSDKKIKVIWDKLEGKTFVEMAKEQGGTQDKYRKIFHRALKKAGINPRHLIYPST